MKIWSMLSISQTGKETHISFIKAIRWYAIRHRSSLRACLFELLDSFFNMKNQKLKQINNEFLVQLLKSQKFRKAEFIWKTHKNQVFRNILSSES